MTTLTDFLLARIAEDEDLALAVRPIGDFRPGRVSQHGLSREAIAHLLNMSPRRVLAECEAKRRIVEMHGTDHECPDDGTVAGWAPAGWYEAEVCPTLRLLALPYADHRDFREEWRP